MRMRFLLIGIGSKEDNCRHGEKDVQGSCAINQDRSIFEMRGLGLEEGTCKPACCLPESIILPVAKSCKQHMWRKEGTQRTSLRVILSLNLIVPVDEMGAVEPVGRFTFEINDDEVCVKNCESDTM